MSAGINAESDVVLARLRAIVEAPKSSRQISEGARERAAGIQRAREYLADRRHRIAFVGQIGVGKSSMIAVLSQLLVGDARPDRLLSLKEQSVLTVGAGRTTVCEVHIRAASPTDPHPFGLFIEPFSIEEMRKEIHFFAADEWARRHDLERARTEDHRGEVQRFIRNMTGLAEQHESTTEGGQRRRRIIDPLDDIIRRHDSAGSLANDLIERADLLSRTETAWWWPEGDDVSELMRHRFGDINHGKATTAMLPRLITLVVPAPLPGFDDGLDIELIDTRGFDGRLAGRPDVREVLRNPRTLVVLCTPFREAPGEAVKDLLRDIKGDAELHQSGERILLVLLDHGHAKEVNGADGDREFGQELKLRECSQSLLAEGLEAFVTEEQMTVYDALQDEREVMIKVLAGRIEAMRTSMLRRLEAQLRDATSFLENVQNERVVLARGEIDRRLMTTLTANNPSGAPLRDPLQGLYEAIDAWRHPVQVYASCRRNGRYSSMDAYAAVRSGASRAATEWLAPLHAAMEGTFNALEYDAEFVDVREHIRLRRSQYGQQRIVFITQYADHVQNDVESVLYPDDHVWEDCAREWGKGAGFKNRVVRHLQHWSLAQTNLRAHEQAELAGVLPITLGVMRSHR